MRSIDITNADIRCCDEICFENGNINVGYELWFDVDKYFGTNTGKDDNVWINFYTYWNPSNGVHSKYFINSDTSDEEHDWELTDAEKDFFFNKMNEFCKKQTKKTLQEYWNECNEQGKRK